jgi:transmembrane sensor
MPELSIAALIERLLDGSITPAEKQQLAQWLLDDSNEEQLHSIMERAWSDFQPGQTLPAGKADQILESILQPSIHRIEPRKKSLTLYRLAAAAVLIFAILTGAGIYLVHKQSAPSPIAATTGKDVAPPSATKAVLTLSDGSRIDLDSAGKGNIATQYTTSVIKQDDGTITYDPGDQTTPETVYNTLTVPRGSRIAQLTLSDGTKVWLNAGSSLRYPVAFTGPDRKVEITGETYFEVAQDKLHPFVVTKGDNEIKVLGTHFNVNAYDEEGPMKVTLLEGSVRITSASGNSLLRPGEMAVMDQGKNIDILNNADLDRIMAWKNGYFNFSNADIRTVMRELSRWYGLELVFNNVTNERFHIEINRDIPLSKVLRILEMTDKIHFTISGNKVTVLP